MIVKEMMTKRINHSKEFFAKQYGHNELEKIRVETMNSYETMKYFVTLDNKYYPNANDIMQTSIKVDYIKNQSFESIEKKIDYMHISSVLMLENWLHNILPKQNENPTSIAKSIGTEESGWIVAEKIMTDMFAMCDDLEKEFENK
jgi:hypothetical protein